MADEGEEWSLIRTRIDDLLLGTAGTKLPAQSVISCVERGTSASCGCRSFSTDFLGADSVG